MVLLDENHRGPIINAMAWILIITAFFFVVMKLMVKWNISRRFGQDDLLLIISFIFDIGLVAGAGVQITNGLGSHMSELLEGQIQSFQKALLATEIFFVTMKYMTKLCYAAVLLTFAQHDVHKRAIHMYRYAMAVWMATSVLVLCFGCQVPATWDVASGKCINFNAFWTMNAIIDIASQVLLSLLPIILLRDLNLSAAKKRTVIYLHLPLMTTIPLTILRLVSIFKVNPLDDLSWNAFFPILYTVLEAQWAVVIVSLTFLIPVIESLATGLISARLEPDAGIKSLYAKKRNGVRSRFASGNFTSGNSETISDDAVALNRLSEVNSFESRNA